MSKSISKLVCFALLLANIVQVGLTVQQWPQRVAIQFNAAGQPGGWASREAHLLLWLAMVVLLPLFMMGVFYSVRFLPDQLINIPHREFWLAGERREQSVRQISRMGYWFTCLLLLFFAVLYWILLAANQAVPPRLPALAMWLLLASFLLAVGGWLVVFYAKFRTPPRE